MSREIVPFAYEPEYEEGEDRLTDDIGSDGSETEATEQHEADDRLGNTDWCTCQMCVTMPSAVECDCCHESTRVKAKFNELLANHNNR